MIYPKNQSIFLEQEYEFLADLLVDHLNKFKCLIQKIKTEMTPVVERIRITRKGVESS